MKRRLTFAAALTAALLVAEGVPAQQAEAPPRAGEAANALRRGIDFVRTLSIHGGYAGIHRLDGRPHYGLTESQTMRPGEILVQGKYATQGMGNCFLGAFETLQDRRHLAAAIDVARALAWSQRAGGGWDTVASVGGLPQAGSNDTPVLRPGRTTNRDGTVSTALEFMMDLQQVLARRNAAAQAPWLEGAIRLGLSHFLATQGDSGGWRHYYPRQGNYHDHWTLNDATTTDAILTLLEAHRRYGRPEYLAAARRGGDFLLRTLRPAPQSAWAQQYDEALKPAGARAFEPAAIESDSTAMAMDALIELYLRTGDERYVRPLAQVKEWADRSTIRPRIWARYYELGSNRPIYSDRTGAIHYELAKVPEPLRSQYTWEAGFLQGALSKLYLVNSRGREGYAKYLEQNEPNQEKYRYERAGRAVPALIRDQDAQGRWVRGNTVSIGLFVRHCGTLLEYLRSGRK